MPSKTRFTELITSYEREIHRYLFRMTGNADDAADSLQNTFLKAFEAFPRLPVDANHRAWLFKIAHRQALNLFRASSHRRESPLEEGYERDDPDLHPEEIAETKRLARTLNHVIHRLTLRQRSAVLLRKYEGLAYRDVAAILGCSEDTARAQVYQAMKKIRNGLSPERDRRKT